VKVRLGDAAVPFPSCQALTLHLQVQALIPRSNRSHLVPLVSFALINRAFIALIKLNEADVTWMLRYECEEDACSAPDNNRKIRMKILN
jgi:hypothetical protein